MEKCHKRHIRQNAISFGPFLLFPAGGILERRVRVRLGNPALAVPLVLVEHAAEVVDANDLITKVWPNQAVKQASLGFQIKALRRALGNGKFRYVTDVLRRRGYCFVAPMTRATLTLSTAENGPSTFSSRSAHALDAKRLQRVLDFIEAKLETDIKVADLASVAALSQFHFSRAFRGATGKTPHRFVSDRRLEKAKALLAKGAMTLGQIAGGCNFSSQASFTRPLGAPPDYRLAHIVVVTDELARMRGSHNATRVKKYRNTAKNGASRCRGSAGKFVPADQR